MMLLLSGAKQVNMSLYLYVWCGGHMGINAKDRVAGSLVYTLTIVSLVIHFYVHLNSVFSMIWETTLSLVFQLCCVKHQQEGRQCCFMP